MSIIFEIVTKQFKIVLMVPAPATNPEYSQEQKIQFPHGF